MWATLEFHNMIRKKYHRVVKSMLQLTRSPVNLTTCSSIICTAFDFFDVVEKGRWRRRPRQVNGVPLIQERGNFLKKQVSQRKWARNVKTAIHLTISSTRSNALP